MVMRKITVRIYARDGLALNYIKNLLKADPNIVIVKPPRLASVTIVQDDLLSPAKQKVLQALAKHGTISKVAASLHYSPGTVKVYLSRIYSKLKVKTATQAVALAMKYGLIKLED